MSCTITYKGQKYSEEQFKEYFINNKNEFVTSISKNKDVIDSFKRKMEGIDFVFSQSPELASIGSKAQYLQYLSTIFKTSKIKDIVYHVGYNNIEKFIKRENGIYFTDNLDYAKNLIIEKIKSDSLYAGVEITTEEAEKQLKKYIVILNSKNILKIPKVNSQIIKDLNKENFDTIKGVEDKSQNIESYVVFEPEQIHILGSKQDIEGFKEYLNSSKYSQLSKTSNTKISEEGLKKVKQLLSQLGVKTKDLLEYAKEANINVDGINGLADLTKGIIAVADGKEGEALTEEAIHIATAILDQTNPKLITEMISKIDRFGIYQQVYEDYKDVYKTKEGKPDIRKIKKEAVDKLLTELIVNRLNNAEQYPALAKEENISILHQWWNAILDWFRGMYKKSNISIFNETADIILNKNIGNVSDIKEQGNYYQLSDNQKEILRKLEETDKIINKEYAEKSDTSLRDTEEASNWYVKLVDGDWVKVKNRVTDRVKDWYEQIFRNKNVTQKDEKRFEILKNLGIEGHSAIDGIILRYVDPSTHKLRESALDKPEVSPLRNDRGSKIYNLLDRYVTETLKQFDKDSLFFPEKVIYSSKEDEAGTIDLLVLEPTEHGFRANVLDWKFQAFDKNQQDVKSYKQKGYNIQIDRYKNILKKEYGINQFRQMRAIPIGMHYYTSEAGNSFMTGIEIGSPDASKITDLKLVPIPIESERTGNKTVDLILDKLSAAYSKIQTEKPIEEEDKIAKRQRLTNLRAAIRLIQTQQDMSHLKEAMEIHASQLKNVLNQFKTDKNMSNKDREELSEEFMDISELVGMYKSSTVALRNVLEKDSDLYKQILSVQSDIDELEEEFLQAKKDFVDSIGKQNNVFGILNPNAILKGAKRMFRSFDEMSLPGARLISTLINRASYDALKKSDDFAKKLEPIIEGIKKGNLSYDLIATKENKLIDEIRIKDFEQAYINASDKAQFLRENIDDMEAYKAEVEKKRDEKIEKAKKRNYGTTDESYKNQLIEDEINRINSEYNYLNPLSVKNQIIIKHLNKGKWYTEEFKELTKEKNKPLLQFYRAVQDLNQIAYENGYIEYAQMRNFLPFMAKGFFDKMADNGWNIFSAPGDFIKSLNESDKRQAFYSEITGDKINIIPKHFTKNIAEKFENGKKTTDYSILSREIGQNVILFAQAMYKFEQMNEINDQIELVLSVEKLKDHIATNKFNKPIIEVNESTGERTVKTLPGNQENYQTLYDFVQYLVYENRYPLSTDQDLGFNKVFNTAKQFINSTFGTDLKPSDTPTSMIKTIDAINRAMQIKTLGGNPISGAVNWFGANLQALSQKSDYYEYNDFRKNQKIFENLPGINEKEASKMSNLIDLFRPFSEAGSYEVFKKAAKSPLNKLNFGDVMMYFMRKTEHMVESANFYALLDNMIIVDGKIVPIKQYLKSKYSDRYSKGSEYLKETEAKIEKEYLEYKKNSILKSASVDENGKLSIPGFNLNNKEEIEKLSILSKNLYRRITGNVSATSINRAKLDVFYSSMMVFKNWIPKLWYTRFGSIEEKIDPFNRDAFDVGRVKVLVDSFFLQVQGRTGAIKDILQTNERGLLALDEMYKKYAEQYFQNTGQEFTMSKEAFNDMIRQNLSNQMRELGILLLLMAAMFSLGFVAPDPDDKRGKSVINITKRTLDQFVQEISFFYNPVNFQQMLSGGAFPALGLVNDIEKFIGQTSKEFTGYDISHPTQTSDEVRQKAHPIKAGLRLVPGIASWMKFSTIISPELAKEYGIAPPQEDYNR